jgi:diguanylate cyclase (GGDEF)-like protein
MIIKKSRSIVDLLVSMSEQNSRQGLASHMVESLNELLTPSYIRYFLVHTGPGLSGKIKTILVDHQDLSQKEIDIADFKGAKESVLEQKSVILPHTPTDDSIRIIIPRIENNRVKGMLIFDQDKKDESSHIIAQLFLDMFTNIKVILDSRDQDPMTGLLNRRSFDETISNVLTAFVRSQQKNRQPGNGACLAVFDIDYFKKVNDTFGHSIGDETLIMFARIMQRVFRRQDKLFRFGGEEFLVLLGLVDQKTAQQTIIRFRKEIEAHNFPQVGQVTVSIGYVMISKEDLAPMLIEKADKALYFSKQNGRNQENAFETLVQQGKIEAIAERESEEVELW